MIGKKLKELRLSRQMTQEELGKVLGVTTSMIGMYETGARNPSYTVLKKIAEYFNVTTDYLLGCSENPQRNIVGGNNDIIDNSVIIGDRIRFFRQNKKLTLKELSLKAGLSISFLSDIENGRRLPSLENLSKIAEALDVSLSDLVEKDSKISEEINEDAEIRAIARAFKELSPKNRKLLLELVESMAEEAKKDHDDK